MGARGPPHRQGVGKTEAEDLGGVPPPEKIIIFEPHLQGETASFGPYDDGELRSHDCFPLGRQLLLAGGLRQRRREEAAARLSKGKKGRSGIVPRHCGGGGHRGGGLFGGTDGRRRVRLVVARRRRRGVRQHGGRRGGRLLIDHCGGMLGLRRKWMRMGRLVLVLEEDLPRRHAGPAEVLGWRRGVVGRGRVLKTVLRSGVRLGSF